MKMNKSEREQCEKKRKKDEEEVDEETVVDHSDTNDDGHGNNNNNEVHIQSRMGGSKHSQPKFQINVFWLEQSIFRLPYNH